MGMFDSVWFACLNCGANVEVQSKAGDCAMREYNERDVPSHIAEDIMGEIVQCTECDYTHKIHGPSRIGVSLWLE